MLTTTRAKRIAALSGGAAACAIALAAIAWRVLSGPQVPAYGVQRIDLRQSVVATGRVQSPRRVEIGSPVTGVVVGVPVAEGDTVHAGQLLVALDPAETRAAVEQARAAVVQAEAKLVQLESTALPMAAEGERQAVATFANAERALTRARELTVKGFAGQASLDEAQRARDVAASQREAARVQRASQSSGGTDVRLARASLDNARAALRVAQARHENTTIEAPVDGVLIARNVEKGAVVQPGKVLMVLSPRGETQLVVQVDEKNLPLVSVGQAALVSADAYPDRRFAATVAYVNPGVDAVRGSIEVKLAVIDPPAYLLQDMTVSVDIAAATRGNVLTIPSDALRPGDWVLAVRDGRAVRQAVKVGARGSGRIEVVGLGEGELVLPAARNDVHEGAHVRTKPATAM